MSSGGQSFLGFLLFIALGAYVYLCVTKRKTKKRKMKTSFWKDFSDAFKLPEPKRVVYYSKYNAKPSKSNVAERSYVAPVLRDSHKV